MQSSVPDYWSIWKQFVLHGVMQEDILHPALLQSWRRCAALGLDPYDEKGVNDNIAPSGIPAVSQALISVVRPAMEDLHQFAEGSQCVVIFADDEACIIDIVGAQVMLQELEHVGLSIGTSWSEEHQGSNALALALRESFPMQLDGAMHYRASLHTFYTSAAPVHDLLGQTIGVLGVIGRHEQCHPHTLGMVTAAAQAISNQLQMQVWLSDANNLLAELQTILQTLSEGILLLRSDGVISQMNAPAGTMLGMIPAKVTGRRLQDVLPLPTALTHALQAHQPLAEEELVFDTVHGRVACLCTLKPLTNNRPEISAGRGVSAARLQISDSGIADGFVLIMRSIERVQKLVNRMTGTRARLTFAHLVGESQVMQEALRLAHLASNSVSTVLLQGETGTGKEIFAQSIHTSSARTEGPFVAINCAAIPRELINTELFGYEGGTFTGADRQGRPGKFEQAHKGTLFLDEIGDMPLDLQASLLRAIETRTIVRIGGHRVIPTDVRIIAATHKDLREEVRRGAFRSDLYYRLNVLTIHVPTLRERVDDLPLLVQHFLQRQSRILGRSFTITAEALQALHEYNWPGNIRELENMLERITYLAPGTSITVEDLPIEVRQALLLIEPSRFQTADQPAQSKGEIQHAQPIAKNGDSKTALKASSVNAEMQVILQAWHASNGHIAQTASRLGISRTTLWRKMTKYGLLNEKAKHM